MMKIGFSLFAFLSILSLPLSADAEPVTVSSIVITGAFRTGEQAVRSMLTVREGSVYPNSESLERALGSSKARMKQTGEYGLIEMITDTADDGSTELIVSVTENFLSPVGPFTLFPNLPVYGLSLGFLLDPSMQGVALGVLLPYPFGMALSVGYRSYGTWSGVGGKLWLGWTPIPELELVIFQDAGYAFGGDPASSVDLTTAAGATIDMSWLADAFGIGFTLWAEGRKGWYQYDFVSGESILEAIVKPFPIVTLKTSINAYASQGDFPPYDDARSRLVSRLDSAPITPPTGPYEASLRVDLVLGKLFDIAFIPLKPAISLYGFWATGSVLPAFTSFSFSDASSAVGGGVEIELRPPVPLVFRFGWSHALAEDRGTFFFTMSMDNSP